MSTPKQAGEAHDELMAELRKTFEPAILTLVNWLDRQLRRSPRLYAWLSR